MIDLMTTEWLNALGWTLIHSLWQGAVIALLAVSVLRIVSVRQSAFRYWVACSALALCVVAACVTFGYLTTREGINNTFVHQPYTAHAVYPTAIAPEHWDTTSLIQTVAATLEQYMPWLLLAWAVGFVVCAFRLTTGLIHTMKIQSSATVINGQWHSFVADTARKLGISRSITLAESPLISAPMVIGYLKPIVLVPVGMFTGLSTDQLETVFMHELAHIRRHDYLINLLQAAVETIFFFNPFVRALSNVVRAERECCCDDIVVRYHGGARVYAHALAQLAEARIASTGFALCLAGDKNQLLHRIKRMLETRYRPDKRRVVVPVVLLLGALMCISWLGTDKSDAMLPPRDTTFDATDTIPKVRSYSRSSVTIIDEDGNVHKTVIEDTIPRPFGFREDWDAMARQLEEQIRQSQEQIRQSKEQVEQSKEQVRQSIESIRQFRNDSLFLHGFMQAFADNWEAFEIPGEAMEALINIPHHETIRRMEEQFERLRNLDLERLNEELRHLTPPLKPQPPRYEEILREELHKDGYLKEGESIESLQWSNDSFKVNGKSVRKEDREKYLKLNDSFFGGWGPGRLD